MGLPFCLQYPDFGEEGGERELWVLSGDSIVLAMKMDSEQSLYVRVCVFIFSNNSA